MSGDDYEFGDDQPKRNPWLEDKLGYAPFAKRLADVIINMEVPNGYVIGLHGRWGSGKTTAVNFILEYLNKRNEERPDEQPKVEHIDFRPWIISGHQDLVAAFFKLLSERLGPRESRPRRAWNGTMRTVAGATDQLVDAAAKLAIAIDPSMGVGAGLAGSLAKTPLKLMLGKYLKVPSLQTSYEELRAQLSSSGRRFLVTVDDIDRLNDAEIRSIMQMVKTVGRLPNVTYVLVYDRDIVWRALDQGIDRVGPKFAEKIVQQEVELPPPTRHALLSILDGEIKFLTGPTEASSRWQYIVRDGVHRWISSPRDVVRLANGLKFAWPALKGEFDPQDLVAIEGIRLFDPEAFDWIRRNRDFLFNEGRYFMGADEERKKNVEALKSSLPTESASILIKLLSVLFPAHGERFQGGRYLIAETNIATQNRRGIGTEAGYDSYFALHPSPEAVPKGSLDRILENLNDQAALSSQLGAYLGRSNNRGRAMVGLLLTDLRLRFAARKHPEPTQALLDVLFSIGEEVFQIPWSGEIFALEPRATWGFLIRDLLEGWGEEQAGEHLKRAFENSRSPFVLADIYVDRGRELGVFPSTNNGRPVISKACFELLGSILLPKILAAANDGSLSAAPFFWDVIRSWEYLGDPSAAKAWLRRGIENSGHFAAKVAQGMVSRSSSGEEVRYQYRRDRDEDMYEIDAIHANAERHLANANDLSNDDRGILQAVVAGISSSVVEDVDD